MIDYVTLVVALLSKEIPMNVLKGLMMPFTHRNIPYNAIATNKFVGYEGGIKQMGLRGMRTSFKGNENANFFVQNSLHKLFTGGFNHNDFSYSELVTTIDKVCRLLKFPAERFKLKGRFEYGVNLQLDCNVNDLINADCSYKKAKAIPMIGNRKVYGKKFEYSKYAFKIYNPIMKMELENRKKLDVPHNILRIEIQTIISELRGKGKPIPVNTLADLKDKNILKRLGEELVKATSYLKLGVIISSDAGIDDWSTYYFFKNATKEQLQYSAENEEGKYVYRNDKYLKMCNEWSEQLHDLDLPQLVREKWDSLLYKKRDPHPCNIDEKKEVFNFRDNSQIHLNTMKQLKEIIRKNGFTYQRMERTDKTAIYAQIDNDSEVIGYEVFKIKTRGARWLKGRHLEAQERFPANEDFGYTAWSYRSIDRAREKFKQLEQNTKISSQLTHFVI